MKRESASQEELIKQVQKLLEERGRKALEMAKETVLQEKVECKEVREALNYFMTEYWQDLARPALLSLCCEAVGGDPDVTTPIAISTMLIGGAIDIHDDIIDQSETKRSRPTVMGKFGKDIALLVGDALLFKGLTLLHETSEMGVPIEKISILSNIIKRMFFELGDAEALELQFRGRIDVTPERYLQVVKKKAADVEAHTRISAILGGGSEEEIEALAKYGRLLGMAIILRDDWIDMFDVKEIRHRIKKEHLPLPLLYVLRNPKNKSMLKSIMLKEKITKKDVEAILEIIYEAGGFEYMKKLMQKLIDDAESILPSNVHNRKILKLLIQSTIPPLP